MATMEDMEARVLELEGRLHGMVGMVNELLGQRDLARFLNPVALGIKQASSESVEDLAESVWRDDSMRVPDKDPLRPGFFARIVWDGVDAYDWTRQRQASGSLVMEDDPNHPDGTTRGKARHIYGLTDLPDDLLVWMHEVKRADGEPTYRFILANEKDEGSRYDMTDKTTGLTPLTTSWDIESQGANYGVKMSYVARLGFTAPNDVSAFYRDLTFDAAGRLVSVSGDEVKVDQFYAGP